MYYFLQSISPFIRAIDVFKVETLSSFISKIGRRPSIQQLFHRTKVVNYCHRHIAGVIDVSYILLFVVVAAFEPLCGKKILRQKRILSINNQRFAANNDVDQYQLLKLLGPEAANLIARDPLRPFEIRLRL